MLHIDKEITKLRLFSTLPHIKLKPWFVSIWIYILWPAWDGRMLFLKWGSWFWQALITSYFYWFEYNFLCLRWVFNVQETSLQVMHSYLGRSFSFSVNEVLNSSVASVQAFDQEDLLGEFKLSSFRLNCPTLTLRKIAEWLDVFSPLWITHASSTEFRNLDWLQSGQLWRN